MMIKLVKSSISLAYSPSSYQDLESARRLIVLVPEEGDYTALTRRIWELANTLGCHILFLSLCGNEAQEASLHRQLITMSAMVQDGKVCATSRVEIGSNWVKAIRGDLHDGDMIVCFAEQRAGLLHRPLSQILRSTLNYPVYILSGLYAQNPSQSHWHAQIMAWLGSISILVGAFLLQIRITSLPQDWAQTTLMIFSVAGELWFVWAWNNLFR
jgi:hypothetical protein